MPALAVVSPVAVVVSLTKEQAERDVAQLKTDLFNLEDNMIKVDHHTRQARTNLVAIRSRVYRLKENDNYRLINSDYKTWADFLRNEFKETFRQTIDKMIAHESVNRSLPADLQINTELHARILAQVPDDMREEIYRDAQRIGHDHPTTGRKVSGALTGKTIAESAARHGIKITGLPANAKPPTTAAQEVSTGPEPVIPTVPRDTTEKDTGDRLIDSCAERIFAEIRTMAGIWNTRKCRKSNLSVQVSALGKSLFEILD